MLPVRSLSIVLNSEIRKIAFVGDYLPRKCGIATFTHDMHASVAGRFPDAECFVVPVNDRPEGYDYPPEVRFEIDEQDLESYLRAADFLNFANTDVVCLQHEYGIYGGAAGSHILGLLRDLRMPVVTTLHTVLREPNADQRRVLTQLADLSARVVVMTERARTFLREIYGVPEAKIDLIAHGIPDTPFVDPNPYKEQFGVEGRLVALTFGLLSPNKGIEHMLRAVPEILEAFPNFVYIVLGATHPDLVREQGERYRLSLERLARDLGIEQARHLLQPVRRAEGADRVHPGGGRLRDPVPEPGADHLGHAGLLVRLRQGDRLDAVLARRGAAGRRPRGARAVRRPEGAGAGGPRAAARRAAAGCDVRAGVPAGPRDDLGAVGRHYMESFQRTRLGRQDQPFKPLAVRTLAEQQADLPDWRLDHLARLTDATGMLQHATHTIPNFAEGYCTDDNARALLLTVLLEELGQGGPRGPTARHDLRRVPPGGLRPRARSGSATSWASTAAGWRRSGRRTRTGGPSGRSAPASAGRGGPTCRPGPPPHFELALPAVLETTSPRAWAFGLLGIREYLRRFGGDRLAAQVRDALTARLLDIYDRTTTPDWPWFEEILSYDIARLPQALIASGRESGNARALEVGLHTLGWLVTVQTAPQEHFRAIGCQRLLPQGARAGPVRPAADRGQRDGLRLPGGVPGRPRIPPG